MQEHLATALSAAVADSNDVWIRREMPMGRRIPDVVMLRFPSPPPLQLWPRTSTYAHAAAIAELRRAVILRKSRLAERLFETHDRVARLVRDLVATGAVIESGNTLRLSPAMRTSTAEVVAIEAKLARWTEAMHQAESYRSFADRVFVAMDAGLFDTQSTRAIAAFRRAGVGLYLVNRSGIQLAYKGRAERQMTPEREYVFASALSTRSQTLWIRR